MSDRLARRALVCALTLIVLRSSPGVAARQAELSGTWTVTFASNVRVESDGSVVVLGRTTAILVVQRQGDSLSGSWTAEAGPNAGVTRQVFGRANGSRFAARTETFRIHGRRNGEPAAWDLWLEWEGTVDGDSIVGTMARVLSKGPRRLDVPWSARRARPGPG